MSDQDTASTPLADEWLGMRVLEHVRELYKDSPETADRILRMVNDRLKHRREVELSQNKHQCRLEWAWFGFRIVMALLGFAALIVYAVVAVQFIGAGSPVQASVALGTGAVSVVTIFVTGRVAGPLFARRTKNERSQA